MLGRRTAASAAVFALLAAGCTTVAPEQSAAPTASSAASPLAATSIVPSLQPSLIITTAPPSVDVATLKPSKPPKPPKVTPSAGAAGPNLVVTKFVADANPFVSGVDEQGHVTLKNIGASDAGSFSLGVNYARDDGLGEGSYSAIPVDGLAAGDSVQVAVNLTLQDTGAITFTATADSGNEIAESNEDDNTKTLSVNAVAAKPNLVIDTFTIQPNFGNPGTFTVDWVIHNVGTADVDQDIDIQTDWYADGVGSGSLPAQSCCTDGPPPNLAAGASHTVELQNFSFASSGYYNLTATVDPANTIVESDDADNYATGTVNVP